MEGLRQPVRVKTLFDDGEERPAGRAKVASPVGNTRIYLCAAMFGAAFLVLAGRLAYVSFGMTEEIRLIRAETQVPARPDILDRRGRTLAMNRTGEGLAIDGRDVWDVDEVVSALSNMFPSIDTDRLYTRLSQKKYALVLSEITPQERRAVMALGLPGMRFPETTIRAYPQKDLAAHVVGYTIPGRGGAIGVEKVIDDMRLAAGEPVNLALDVVAQQVLEDELAAGLSRFSAKAAWGVLLNAKTGEVRALASLPDFNPNRLSATKEVAWKNRTMSDAYELGSAFKAITAAAAIDAKAVSLSETFDVSKAIEVGGWPIDDYSRKRHPLTVSEVVQYSSNIGTVRMVQKLGAERFKATLGKLGLDKRLETDLPEGRMPTVSKTWRASELASTAYGHGISVSPLQLTAAFAAVVNGGTYRVPHFVKGTPQGEALDEVRAFSEHTSARMRIILRKAVTEGTGRNAEAAGYYTIGKTATADKPGRGGYDDNGELISSFIGAFPGYDPEYVLLISFDEPQGISSTHGFATAGYVAAPVFRRVVERVAPALGLMPVGDDVAFDGFMGLRKETSDGPEVELDALATLLVEAAY
ncbi:MAG: penicillin-binding protein 2 [Pseudomonadota bacterium]